MAATFGKLEDFDTASSDNWIQYIERMEYYFQANKITTGEMKCTILISAMGGKNYKLMRNLISPDKPGDKSFGELVEVMTKHFCLPPSEIVQRYKFIINWRHQWLMHPDLYQQQRGITLNLRSKAWQIYMVLKSSTIICLVRSLHYALTTNLCGVY